MSTSSLFPEILGLGSLSTLDYWLPFIGIAGGYLFGAMLTWLLMRNRLLATRTRLEERLRASEKHVADLEAGAARLEHEVAQIRKAEATALKRQGLLEASMTTETEKAEEKIKLLNKAEAHMLDSFRLISRETLKEGQDQYVAMSARVFEGQLETWRNDCEQLIKPLEASLTDIHGRLDALEKSREGATRILREQIARAVESEEDHPAEAPAAAKRTPIPMPPTVKVGSDKTGAAPDPKSSDPRPYANPATPTPVPVAAPRNVTRSTPSTFMEDLDDTPLGARPEQRPVAPVTPLPPAKPQEERKPLARRDVLDDEIEDKFEGFEAQEEAPAKQAADPKRAADDLRAALES